MWIPCVDNPCQQIGKPRRSSGSRRIYVPVFPQVEETSDVHTRIHGVAKKRPKTLNDLAYAVLTLERWIKGRTQKTVRIEELEPEELDSYLADFFPALKKADGSDYDIRYVSKLRCCIDRFLKEKSYPHSIETSDLFTVSQCAFSVVKQRLSKLEL